MDINELTVMYLNMTNCVFQESKVLACVKFYPQEITTE
jgi:hypothetical protein